MFEMRLTSIHTALHGISAVVLSSFRQPAKMKVVAQFLFSYYTPYTYTLNFT